MRANQKEVYPKPPFIVMNAVPEFAPGRFAIFASSQFASTEIAQKVLDAVAQQANSGKQAT